jgi:predicted cupin superfamily sugar epimerase
MTDPAEIVRTLDLVPHPEGGYYRETFRDEANAGGRAYATHIYYLLRAGEESRWHRIDASEIWHFYLGDPLELFIAEDGAPIRRIMLGSDLAGGELLHFAIPKGAWQSARPLGAFALLGCTVAPGFEFSGFEFAPDGWEPPSAS